jgi:uncharacterized protein YbjT (DUF2867 family)
MILIFGAGGAVGSEVARQLQAAGVPFKAGYSTEAKAGTARGEGIDAVVADYNDPDSLDRALIGVDTVFLLSPSDADLELKAVEAAKRALVTHIVKLSAWGAEMDSFSFARIHRQVERAIEASGIAWTFLRPNGFMQNMANYSGQSIREQGAFYNAVGDARISHIDIRDIAAVAVKALTEPGHEHKAYALSGPEALTYAEMASTLSAALGKPVKYVDLTPEQYKQGMMGAGIPEFYADRLLDLARAYREGIAAPVTGEVKRITGREPISFAQYASEWLVVSG